MKTQEAMTTYPKPITVRLSDNLYRFVKGRAKKGQTKVSEVVRTIVRERMEEDAKKAAEAKQ